MTLQISQRGKEYLKTAQTLLRAAQTMTDERLRVSLRPLPTTELRKLRMLMRPTHSLDRLLTPKASGVHDLMGSFTAHPAEEIPSYGGMPGARLSHELFIPSLPPAELEGWSRYPRSRSNDYRHPMADSFSN